MKAVAIPYIIALVLGIFVVGLLGYWFISQGGKTIVTGSTAECDGLCASWRNSGFKIKPSNAEKVCGQSEGVVKAFCMTRLECKTEITCSEGRIDYGPAPVGSTLRYCCP